MKKLMLMMTMLFGLSGMTLSGMALAGDDGVKEKGHHGYHAKHHRGEMMFNKLSNLTEEQKASIQKIHEEYREQKKAKMKANGHGRGYHGLMDLDPQDANYQQQVEELAKRRADAVEQSILAKAEKHAKIHAVLTEEQREELKQLHDKKREKMKKHFKKNRE